MGAVAGGLAGKAIAEKIDPAAEDAYWRDNYTGRPYVERAGATTTTAPPIAYGVDSYSRYSGRTLDDAEPEY